jgi:hypothetical protein
MPAQQTIEASQHTRGPLTPSRRPVQASEVVDTPTRTRAWNSVVAVLFLLTVAALDVHMAEEYLARFGPAMSRLFDISWTERSFLLIFAFVGPSSDLGAALHRDGGGRSRPTASPTSALDDPPGRPVRGESRRRYIHAGLEREGQERARVAATVHNVSRRNRGNGVGLVPGGSEKPAAGTRR